jgi:regulator of sigma E protease
MFAFLTNILAFVVLLGVLVFIHELGHFLVAKKNGIRVDRFSLGFPPNIFNKTWRGTEYTLGIIPLGGYVKMAGESPDEATTGRDDEFASKKIWQRFSVVAAGPFMNYLLAIGLFGHLFFWYGEPARENALPILGEVSADSPAESSGLQVGDLVLTIAGAPINGFPDLIEQVKPNPGQALEFTWLRGNDTLSAMIIPENREVELEDGSIDTIGLIGVREKAQYVNPRGFFAAITDGFTYTNEMVYKTFEFVKLYVTAEVAATDVGGPIFIAQQSGQAASHGAFAFLNLMAFLSVNLAVLNILPIPVLDGGHMVFLAIEKIKGSPLTTRVRMIAQQAGMLFLMSFILFVSWNDIVRWLNLG